MNTIESLRAELFAKHHARQRRKRIMVNTAILLALIALTLLFGWQIGMNF